MPSKFVLQDSILTVQSFRHAEASVAMTQGDFELVVDLNQDADFMGM